MGVGSLAGRASDGPIASVACVRLTASMHLLRQRREFRCRLRSLHLHLRLLAYTDAGEHIAITCRKETDSCNCSIRF